MIKNQAHPNLLQFELFNEYAESLCHFSSTIVGGVSDGNYATFNLGMYAEDSLESVSENRKRLTSMVGIDEEGLLIPYQTHGDKILLIDKAFLSKSDLEQASLLNGVDAVITDQKNICIGVTTADCVPILLYDPLLKVFGAVHAGWRGTVAKLVEKTISEMSRVFGCKSENLIAGIGPAISQEFFDVGDEVVEAFVQAEFPINSIGYKNPETGKTHIDLSFANDLMLTRAGILFKNTEVANLCTYLNSSLLFSARRQGVLSGRMISGGMLL